MRAMSNPPRPNLRQARRLCDGDDGTAQAAPLGAWVLINERWYELH